jgi:polar amino acid transport system ATP-binding protein
VTEQEGHAAHPGETEATAHGPHFHAGPGVIAPAHDLLAAVGGLSDVATETVVEATDVHKSFGRTEVLKGISLTVRRAEVVVLIGASGSGKTTFLRCINHLEKIQQGRIMVNGHLIGYREGADGRLVEDAEKNIALQRRDIGFVFQRFNLFP